MFTPNVGGIDRIIRIVAGLVLLAVGFGVISGVAGTIVGVAGLVALLTGLVRWCPAYLPCKIDTRKA